jgi:HrpA-like RNA helicase
MAQIQKAAAGSGISTVSDIKTNNGNKASDDSVATQRQKAQKTPTDSMGSVETKGDAILVFLSGLQAIEKVSRAIRQRNVLLKLNAQLFILHGSMPPEQQRKVFKTTLPGQWKVVLATNIGKMFVLYKYGVRLIVVYLQPRPPSLWTT